MFGRSGQMFPRQRAFHDAIYEEEYGSEQEDECCQSRGMSAVFCWFLSVIILIGLAASVVLTVFFILKSKSTISKNGELDVLYDGEHGINFHFPTTTEPNSLDFPISASSSKESSIHNNHSFEDDNADEDETENNDFGTTTAKATTTSTRFPPSRRGPFEMSNEKNTEESEQQPGFTGSGNPQNPDDFPQSASRESYNSRPRSEEIPSKESSNRHSTSSQRNDKSKEYERPTTIITTTTSTIPSQHVLFTSLPDTPVTNATPNRRNLQTTRFPTGRTSFSTSTPSLQEDDDEAHVTNGQYHPQDHDEDEDHPTPTQYDDTVTAPTVLYESKERGVDAKYQEEESQLKKMLQEEIPPHKDHELEHTENDNSRSHESSTSPTTLSSEFNLPTTTIPTPTRERDPLARIIKNLAPKWGRNRTIETTTISSGNHKYDFTISSKEKDRTRIKESEEKSSKTKWSKETSTRSTLVITPETTFPTSKFKSSEFEVVKLGGKRGSTDQPINILNTVQSPNLSRRQDQQTEHSDRDSPFLDVLVGSEDHKTLITKQTEDGIVTSAILPPWYANSGGNGNNNTDRIRNTTVTGNSDEAEHEKQESSPTSVFGGLLDFFKKLPMSGDKQHGSNSKSIVLKRPGGELIAQGSSYVPQSPENNENEKRPPTFNDLVRRIIPGIQSTASSLDSAVVTDDIHPANNAYHYGSSDGGTNVYGYYPDEDGESDKTVEHHGLQSETLSDEMMEGIQEAPSHSIELQVGSEGSSEITITQGQANDDQYSRYGEGYTGAETHRQVVTVPFHGGGIRRPISKESKEELESDMDLDMKGSEIRPVFVATTSQLPPTSTNLTIEKVGINSQAYDSRISNASTEMIDSSAGSDPSPEGHKDQSTDFEHGSFEEADDSRAANLQKGVPEESMGSYEETEISGSREGEPVKWSELDKFQPESSDEINHQNQPPPTGSEELKVNPDSGDGNEVLERKPVVQLDEGLYPDSADTSAVSSPVVQSTESKVVHQVFPEGYSSTTTERPYSDESTILEPERSANSNSSTGSGFVAPTPVSFHDNKYTFSAPSSDAIFQSKDGWRPLVVNSNEESHEDDPASAPHWERRQPLISRQPNGPPSLPHATHSKPAIPNQSFEEEEEDDEEGETEHDEDLHKYTWGERERHLEKQEARPVGPSFPAKVRFPENQSVQEHYSHEQQQAQPPPPQRQQVQQHHIPSHPPHLQAQPRPPQQKPAPHPHQNPQQVQPHPPQQTQSHPQQQQRQQFHYQNNHNIDRSKYMMRPALPPIVMRRPPIQGIPYAPNRGGNRPQLIPQVQQQNQFVNNPHPTEFPHPVNRRIFKNLGPRPRGNINWPTDETRKVDTAERRTG